MELSDEQFEQCATAISHMVYQISCPVCNAAETAKCLRKKRDGWSEIPQPHRERITLAVTVFMQHYLRK